jgi:hypothetical protein
VVVSQPPVYAPALVAFVGGGGGGVDWGVNLAIGGVATAGVAWFALGPGEAWHPQGGGWSPRYYNRVNDTVVVNNYNRQVNVTNVNIHNTYINYRAPGAVTAVPATAFVHGQPVGRFAQKVDPQQWHNARIMSGAPGIAPVSQSFASGMRNATYRPPATVMSRPVVATRGAAVPPAYHDTLAQHYAQGGARVPGAGNPVVRTSVPANFAATQTHGGPAAGMANVRVVQSHTPGTMPGAAQRVAQGAPGAPQRPGEAAPNGAQAQRGVPEQARPGTNGQPAQVANERPQPNNGVPRPPQVEGGGPNAVAQRGQPAPAGQQAAEGRHEPAWTQPHPPMAQQAEAHGGEQNRSLPGAVAAREPEQTQQRGEARPAENPAMAQQPREETRPQQDARQPEPVQQAREGQQAARAPEHQPQAQPREESHPQAQQPRPEQRPQQAQQPRPEPRQQQAREPQPQPHPEQHPPQQAQHQQPHQEQHQEQHSSNGHDEHRKG